VRFIKSQTVIFFNDFSLSICSDICFVCRLIQKRTVRLQRKAMSSRNPLKALAARTDLQDEYIEVRSGVAEKELKRLKVEKCEFLVGSLLLSISTIGRSSYYILHSVFGRKNNLLRLWSLASMHQQV